MAELRLRPDVIRDRWRYMTRRGWRRRGLDVDEVRDFLALVADYTAVLETRLGAQVAENERVHRALRSWQTERAEELRRVDPAGGVPPAAAASMRLPPESSETSAPLPIPAAPTTGRGSPRHAAPSAPAARRSGRSGGVYGAAR